jgi:ATP synthase protein I
MRLPEEYTKYLGLGAEIAAAIVIPIGLGYLVDALADTSPYGVLIGAISGMGLFFTMIFKIAREFGKEESEKSRKND